MIIQKFQQLCHFTKVQRKVTENNGICLSSFTNIGLIIIFSVYLPPYIHLQLMLKMCVTSNVSFFL